MIITVLPPDLRGPRALRTGQLETVPRNHENSNFRNGRLIATLYPSDRHHAPSMLGGVGASAARRGAVVGGE